MFEVLLQEEFSILMQKRRKKTCSAIIFGKTLKDKKGSCFDWDIKPSSVYQVRILKSTLSQSHDK